MAHPYLSYLAVFVGLMPGLHSITMLINPEIDLKAFHIPDASTPKDRKTAGALLRISALRNIVVSYLLTLNWYFSGGDETQLGLGMLGALLMCTGDGIIVQHLTGGHGWQHWWISVMVSVIISGLLGVFS